MKKLRILYFDVAGRDSPGNGGTSDIIWQMATAMRELGHEPVIAGYYQNTDYPDPLIEVCPIVLPEIFHRNIVTQTAMSLAALRYIHRIPGIQLVHLKDYFHAGVFARLDSKLPVVLTTPGNIFERRERGIKHFDEITEYFFQWAARATARRGTRVIAHSTEQRDWWLYTGTSPLRMSQIPLGVDTSVYHPIEDARSELGITADAKIVLFVGRLYIELKGIDYLLAAYEQALAQDPALELHFVGDGPDRPTIEKWAIDRGLQNKIRFWGWVKDKIPLIYNAADVCVLTSRSESFSRVMIEAMACGVPFIGCPHGGMLDHITSGVNGYVIEPENTTALATTILALVNDPALRREIGENGCRYVHQHLTWSRVMQRVCDEVYLPILHSREKDQS